jgi:hypothetical protein
MPDQLENQPNPEPADPESLAQEPAPMLDVHPAHHVASSWRDFFIHIATICIGLLIAIGLEQTVEAIHHHRELRELREAMVRDSEKALADAEHVEAEGDYTQLWLAHRLAQVRTALAQRQPLAKPEPPQQDSYDYPLDPTWKAAKTTGLLALMPPEEVKAYAEADDVINNLNAACLKQFEAFAMRSRIEAEFSNGGPRWSADLSTATKDDLLEYQRLLRAESAAVYVLRDHSQVVRGAETAILHGARSIDDVQRTEKEPLPAARMKSPQ